jgi:TolA-binding protein
VIYKCNAGILLHDLRNDWVDDLYFLMGKAYYLRKNFDSAAQVFSYVSYAFAKKVEGYDVPVGSNASGSEFSIATKEKKGSYLTHQEEMKT